VSSGGNYRVSLFWDAADLPDDVFEIRGLCMRGLLRPGDLIRFRRVPSADLRLGDLLVFLSVSEGPFMPSAVSAHRLLWKRRTGKGWRLLTKGDASLLPDPWTPESALVGRVVATRRPGEEWRSVEGPAARLRHSAVGFFWTCCFLLRGAAGAALGAALAVLEGSRFPGLRPLRGAIFAVSLRCEDI
jgi:hypothetical protein